MANKKNQPVADNSVTGNLEEKIAALQMEKDALEETVKEFAEQDSLMRDTISQKEEEIQAFVAQLEEKEKNLQIERNRAAALEGQLKKVEKVGAASGKQETEQEYLERRKTIKLNGRIYAFKFGTPNKISVDGKAMEIDDVIKNEVLMEELIVGNLSFVEQVN